MRIALLTEGGYPYARGESVAWCDRLVRGLGGHEFEVYALSRSERQESAGWCALPDNVQRVHTAPLWGRPTGRAAGQRGRASQRAVAAGEGAYGRRERHRFDECFRELAAALCGAGPDEARAAAGPGGVARAEGAAAEGPAAGGAEQLADRFANGLYGLAELARERGGLSAALRSERAARILQAACRAPGTLRAVQAARVADLLAVTGRLERALRPLSLDWYGAGHAGADRRAYGQDPCGSGDPGLAAADLCHAVGGGPAALPGLLAKRFFGTPLLITEYGVRTREHYLASAADAVAPSAAGAPVRALLASFQRRLAREAYAQAQLITPGNTHARRWQERCGAPRDRLRTVYPGMDAAPFAEVGEAPGGRAATGTSAGSRVAAPTLVRVGRIEPGKDLIGLLHAFAEVRRSVPGARLRIVTTAPGRGPEAGDYEARCRALAAQLFPDEAAGAAAVGTSPVTFEEVGGPGAPTLAAAYGAGCVAVLSSVIEGFPVSLVEAMFCGRATVSTDVGAVCEVIGGTGLVVPPRNPRAFADHCVALLRDPARRARLGAAARARALELFTVEQNIAAFRGIYLELMSHCPVRRDEAGAAGADGDPLPFARPAESHVPGRWAGTGNGSAAAAASVTGGRRPGVPRGPAPSSPGARRAGQPASPAAASASAPAPAAAAVPGSLRARPSVPRWARPDLPDGAPIALAGRARTGLRKGERR